MTVNQICKEIKNLSPEKQSKVLDFMLDFHHKNITYLETSYPLGMCYSKQSPIQVIISNLKVGCPLERFEKFDPNGYLFHFEGHALESADERFYEVNVFCDTKEWHDMEKILNLNHHLYDLDLNKTPYKTYILLDNEE